MQPEHGVRIEPEAPSLPDEAQGLELLRAVRGRGRDATGLVELELDAAGDLLDVVVTDLAVESGARAVASAFAEAYAEARGLVATQLEEHAEQAAVRIPEQQETSLANLQQVAGRAEKQLEEILGRLARIGEQEQTRG